MSVATDYFVCVGAQKAGTTWLHEQLALHPQIAMPERKEVHYFDTAFPVRAGVSFGVRYVRNIRRAIDQGKTGMALRTLDVVELAFHGPERYRAYLDAARKPESLIAGEVTPGYATLTEESFEAMRAILGSPKVIFVMRDPVERYWSSMRMGAPDPVAAAERFRRDGTDETGNHERDDYEETVTLLDRVFGDDVLYLFYEHLFSEESLRAIGRHLGVRETWPWQLSLRSRVGVSAEMPELTDAVRARLTPQYAFVRERFGDAVPEVWRDLRAS